MFLQFIDQLKVGCNARARILNRSRYKSRSRTSKQDAPGPGSATRKRREPQLVLYMDRSIDRVGASSEYLYEYVLVY